MNERTISRKEQLCVSECIYQHWGRPDADIEDESRNRKYEQCLTSCDICG
jgi:hypothetical protein